MLKVIKKIILVLCVFASTLSYSTENHSHHPQDFLKSIAGKKDEGEKIVQHYCATCHAEKPLIQLGAPRIKHCEDWEMRLQQGLNKLFEHSDQGLNAMPPRGGCFECSDGQLMLAIQALLGECKR